MSGSGHLDEDTARTINSGRETLGVVLRTAQRRLQYVFVAFVVGLFAGIVAMRSYIWPQLKHDLINNPNIDVIFQTPFDVILLQVKIGLVVGVVTALPVLLYFAREPMRRRGMLPDVTVARWKVAAIGVLALLLSAAGIAYSYLLFFPIMFRFLATNAMSAGLAPRYSIVMWTQFILVLALSFGLAAQLPLAMSGLAYTGIVPYETFRDRWKYAVVLIFTFGAVFSPPDPFTQIMWALPLLCLYGASLYLTKVVVTMKRGSERVDLASVPRDHWNVLAGAAVVASALTYYAWQYGVGVRINAFLLTLPAKYRPPLLPPVGALLGLPRPTALLVGAAIAGLLGAMVALLALVYLKIEAAAAEEAVVYGGKAPRPENLNLDLLDASGVRAAPDERFAAMDEDEALQEAQRAMSADDDEKARAILDRFDAVQESAADETDGEAAAAGGDAADAGDGAAAGSGGEESGNVFTSTTAGMMDAFTEEETTEEDVGGYYYDIAFVLDSLRSRMVWLVLWFMLVLAGSFFYLYRGGLGAIRDDFLQRIPAQVAPAGPARWPITLHPVEALVFEVKVSTVLAVIATLPLIVYWAWPALVERGIVTGDRRAIAVWGGSLVLGLVGGSFLGYFYVAPTVITYLVVDALQANMVISYRISNFLWLVFLTTAGIGLLADIPITMVLFHYGGVVDYETMRRRWRVPVLSGFVFGALVTPESVYTMLVVAVPIAVAYGLGLGIVWLASLGGRFGGKPPSAEGRTV